MDLAKKISAFTQLGKILNQLAQQEKNNFTDKYAAVVQQSYYENGWFIAANVNKAMRAIADMLSETKLQNWASAYPEINSEKEPKRVGVIMAGNIPAVGFHDFLCVLMSGNIFVGKCASDDKLLLPFIAEVLCTIEPHFKQRINFTPDKLENVQAYIATGSNNSARYFQSYFAKHPHIIRRNRNSIAVLSGNETPEQLQKLSTDVFDYFGLGCRNVSKLFVPTGYNFDNLFNGVYNQKQVIENKKYANNYEYNRTIYLMGSHKILDNNFLILKEDIALSSPIAVLFYEYYNAIEDVQSRLRMDAEHIQCVVSAMPQIKNAVDFGNTQCPQLNDYADNVDTLKILSKI